MGRGAQQREQNVTPVFRSAGWGSGFHPRGHQADVGECAIKIARGGISWGTCKLARKPLPLEKKRE